MSNIANSSTHVIADYQSPYPDPISVCAGDQVTIDDNMKTDCRGWVWCTNQSGKSGWVPETYLDRQGALGYLRYDYDAIELSVRVGETLTCHKEESGFIWVTNRSGQSGWVPSTHIEFSSATGD